MIVDLALNLVKFLAVLCNRNNGVCKMKCRTRNNHTKSEEVNVNRIITAQQFGYDASNKNWKLDKRFKSK